MFAVAPNRRERRLRLPVPGIFEEGTFLRGRVVAHHARASDHSCGEYDVQFSDGPYDDDETPDGSVRLMIAASADDQAGERSRLDFKQRDRQRGVRNGIDADPRASEPATLVLKGVRPSLMASDSTKLPVNSPPFFIVAISALQVNYHRL